MRFDLDMHVQLALGQLGGDIHGFFQWSGDRAGHGDAYQQGKQHGSARNRHHHQHGALHILLGGLADMRNLFAFVLDQFVDRADIAAEQRPVVGVHQVQRLLVVACVHQTDQIGDAIKVNRPIFFDGLGDFPLAVVVGQLDQFVRTGLNARARLLHLLQLALHALGVADQHGVADGDAGGIDVGDHFIGHRHLGRVVVDDVVHVFIDAAQLQ